MKNQGMFISLLLCFVVKLFNPFKVILLSKENEVYFACRFTSVWLVIDLSMLLFSDSVMKILKKIQISFSVGNFLSFEKIKNQSMPLCTSQIFYNYYVDALSTS